LRASIQFQRGQEIPLDRQKHKIFRFEQERKGEKGNVRRRKKKKRMDPCYENG